MNTTRRIIGAVLSLLLALTFITGIITPAFAAEDAPGADDAPDCVSWEVSFDKAKYFLFDKVTAIVKYTNTSSAIKTNNTTLAPLVSFILAVFSICISSIV